MRGLVIPLYFAPPASSLSGTVFNPPLRVWVRAEDRVAGFPVMDWISATVDQARWDIRSKATLTVPASAYWLTQAALAIDTPAYAKRISMDVYWQDMTTPIFSGPPVSVKQMSTRRGTVLTFSFKHFLGHFLGRRVNLSTSTTGAKVDLASGKADTALANFIRANGFSASTLTPAGYPEDREDFDDWNPTCNTAAGTHATTINPDVSWGRRMAEEVENILDANNMFLGLSEVSAAAWEMDVDADYEEDDLTNEVVLDLRRGTLSSYEREINYEAIENTIALKVPSANVVWTSDSALAATDGVHEGVYSAQEFDASAASDEKNALLARFKEGSTTYGGVIVDQPGATFMVDYFRRSLVTIRDAVSGVDTTKLIVGSKISATGRRLSASVVVGDPPDGWTAGLIEGDGTPLGGGRGLGSRFKVAQP